MQGSLLLCAALLAALCAHAAACFCPVYCVPNDAEKTGRYIAVLRDDTSRERLHVIVETINSYEGCTVHDYMDVAAKSILLGLSPDALQMVLQLQKFIQSRISLATILLRLLLYRFVVLMM